MTRYTRHDFFVNHAGIKVDLNVLRRAFLKRCKQVGNPVADGKVTNTQLWLWIVMTDWGCRPYYYDAGFTLLSSSPHLHSPWAGRLAGLKANSDRPRVHISGTKAEVREVPENPLELPLIRQLIEKHGLKDPSFSFTVEAGQFWEGFYDQENYVQDAVDVPSLMIATGSLRDYWMHDQGMTINVEKGLKEIISPAWGIPVEMVASYKP